jgi:hypothetical protein
MFHSGGIAILTDHALDESGLSIPPRIFAVQMRIPCECGIRVIPLSEGRPVLYR